MKSIVRVVSIGLGLCAASALAGDTQEKQKELEAIKVELKPLREKAYQESDVAASREKLDAAYRAYWESVRAAMLRLDPSKKALIERDVALRKELSAVSGESHTRKIEKKDAAEKKSP